jgi:hypothetical protein
MPKRARFFVDTFTQLSRLSSDRHWQRALDAAKKWERMATLGTATAEQATRIGAFLEREDWNGPHSLWRSMHEEFVTWARSHGFTVNGPEPYTALDSHSYRDVVDHTILYYFPSLGELTTESKRGLFVALRWKRLLAADQVSRTDVEGVLGALEANTVDCDAETYGQWQYLKNQFSSWAVDEGILSVEDAVR